MSIHNNYYVNKLATNARHAEDRWAKWPQMLVMQKIAGRNGHKCSSCRRSLGEMVTNARHAEKRQPGRPYLLIMHKSDERVIHWPAHAPDVP